MPCTYLYYSTIYAFPASQPIPYRPQVAFTQVNISVCLTFGPSLVSLRLKRRGYNYRIQEIQVKKKRQTDESMEGWKGREKEWSENGRNKSDRNGRGKIGRRTQDGVERTDYEVDAPKSVQEGGGGV
jgi:hypothetical protein